MAKIIKKFDADIIRKAVDMIAEPVVQTITPQGNNVLFERDWFPVVTNDGATIAKMIESDDEIEDIIIQLVKSGAIATNDTVGDATSTTILYIQQLVHLGLEEMAAGKQPMTIKRSLERIRDSLLDGVEDKVKELKEKDYFKVALVSASGDEEIAENVVEIISSAGTEGMIFLNESKDGTTRITKDVGYNIEEPMAHSSFGNVSPGRSDYLKPVVVVTSKKLYHISECKEILEVAHKLGHKDVVLIARDFLGESLPFLAKNHQDPEVPLNILPIKYSVPDNDFSLLNDLATYIGTEVINEELGDLTGKLESKHYAVVDRVYTTGKKTIVLNTNDNSELNKLVESLQKEDQTNKDVKKRLASLTTGTVTVEVGASTGPELREKLYRYEDAVSALRAAIKSGYVTGGGITLFEVSAELNNQNITAKRPPKHSLTEDERRLTNHFGRCAIQQISENVGMEFKEEFYGNGTGLNAKTLEYSKLESDGIIEPADSYTHAIKNAFATAIAILTSGYIISNKNSEDEK